MGCSTVCPRPHSAFGRNAEASRSGFEDREAAGSLAGIRPRQPSAAIKVSATIPNFGAGVADWPQTLRLDHRYGWKSLCQPFFRDGDFENGELGELRCFQYTLQDPALNELNRWAPNVFDKLKTLHELLPISRPEAWH